MAKKKKSKDVSVQLQELANAAQIQIQQLANEATEKSFKYNSAEAATNRAWQKEMSDTSHQREVADLKKAGLNPVLSANQGAMSYTSSSASAQAESGASGASNVAGSLVSSLAGYESTKTAAAANLKAARTQAAATRAAAAASAAAQRYAADQHYAANKYAWDSKVKLTRESWKNAPQGSIAGLIDKHLGNTGIPNRVTSKIKSFFGSTNAQGMFSNFTSKSWTLNKTGVKKVNSALNSMGLAGTSSNRKLFVNGFILGNKTSIATLNRIRSRY